MNKLFKYELRRLLINKFFFGLLAVAALYGWHLMRDVVILGVSNTAPFSGWSYGTFLASVLPILLVAMLFFVSFLYSDQERKVRTLTEATPIDPVRFGFLRCGAMIVGFLLIAVVPVGLSLWFYAVNFRFTNFGGFVLPAMITLVPAMIFTLGLGMAAGRLRPSLVYVLMLVVLLLGYFPLPYAVDLFGSNFFQGFPLKIPMGADMEPAFTVPAGVWIGKISYMLIGIVLAWVGLRDARRRKTVS